MADLQRVIQISLGWSDDALTNILHVSPMKALVWSAVLNAIAAVPDLRSRWADFFAGSRQILGTGALFSGADYVQAQRVRRVGQRQLAALFTGVDLIVTPGASQGATSLARMEEEGAASLIGVLHTAYWNAVGNPALVVPMGFTADGLPLSLQLGARPFEEALLVQAGDAYQQATDWHLSVPPLATSLLTL